MKRIATLGPVGTFSGKATEEFRKTQGEHSQVEYFPSIKKALEAVGNSTDLGVLPIENLSEGFVSVVLDYLAGRTLTIIDEIIVPIQFSFVANVSDLKDVHKVFSQFVAKGQCSDFIESLDCVEMSTTESNIESLDRLSGSEIGLGAIVPAGSYQQSDFPLIIDNVNDRKNNQTRFLVFSTKPEQGEPQPHIKYKSSIIVIDDKDHPGFLDSILSPFSKNHINLTSIVSRPSGAVFGKYHFFVDFDGHVSETPISQVLAEISLINKVKVLGSYPVAQYI